MFRKGTGLGLLALAALAGCSGESEAWKPVEVGAPAPEFAAARLAGDTLTLADLRGEAVLLNVWATWCPPCREEMPGLQALHERYDDRGLNVVGVSVDSRGSEAAIREFVTQHDITFDILHDASDVVSRRFRTQGVPETFLIDREGVIVKRWIGKFDPLEPAVLEEVEAVLAREHASS